MTKFKSISLMSCMLALSCLSELPTIKIEVSDTWKIDATLGDHKQSFDIEPAEVINVENEGPINLPFFNHTGPEYNKGYKLKAIRAQECSVRYALDPDSLRVFSPINNKTYIRGNDYEAELSWGGVGRLKDGEIKDNSPVILAYKYGTMRLDSLILEPNGRLILRQGRPHVSQPTLPELKFDEQRVATIWITPRLTQLTDKNLFPVIHDPEFIVKNKQLLTLNSVPNAVAKLKAGKMLHILAWGDSVTSGTYLENHEQNRWQEQFVRWLRTTYPQAEIRLTTEAWGGRSTLSYFNEPPGSQHNYQEKVLDPKPDLIISEFVNDARLNQEAVNKHYGRILSDFKSIDAEWIILTPHYVRSDWMGLISEKECDSDPRPYVKALRIFAEENQVALADAALLWGELWRQGIPYSTLLTNNINHPNAYGMSLFVKALKPLFLD